MMAAASLAKGTSVVVENVFENRFAHAGDLNRMGANILINGRTAVIRGVERLSGARVTARDLRGGAALAIAGLAAQGETVVERARLIDRGYEHLETALSHLEPIFSGFQRKKERNTHETQAERSFRTGTGGI